jgi:hypothetical protein
MGALVVPFAGADEAGEAGGARFAGSARLAQPNAKRRSAAAIGARVVALVTAIA